MNLNGGYAMIKYNSTQEELQIAYRSKRPTLFYDENQRAHWAVIEEKSTESVDEETQEPITIYEYSYKLLDEANAVVANPTLSGDEATLDGVEIDGTKYKVGGSNLLDDIVDSKGNKRFIEGSGTPANVAGMIITYNKWSLSGTHLMLVVAGTFEQNVSALTKLFTFELPEWILNKIDGLGLNNEIDRKNFNFYYESGQVYSRTEILRKEANSLVFIQGNLIEPNGKLLFRIQFDLLIDSE